jgi:Family of unknown function (DUF5681)
MAIEREYTVGKGKPPLHTRFQKGQSGNPKGHRKGSRNVATLLEQALNERVFVTENGKRKTITKLEAMLKQLANKAASGDHRAIKLLMPLAETCLASSSSAASDAPAPAPLPSAAERRARALETIKILKEVGYFDHAVDTTPEVQAGGAEASPETEAYVRKEHNSEDRR